MCHCQQAKSPQPRLSHWLQTPASCSLHGEVGALRLRGAQRGSVPAPQAAGPAK